MAKYNGVCSLSLTGREQSKMYTQMHLEKQCKFNICQTNKHKVDGSWMNFSK